MSCTLCEAGHFKHGDPDIREGKGHVDSKRRPSTATVPKDPITWGACSPSPSAATYSVDLGPGSFTPFLLRGGSNTVLNHQRTLLPPAAPDPRGRPSRFHLQGEAESTELPGTPPPNHPLVEALPAVNNQDKKAAYAQQSKQGDFFLFTETADRARRWAFFIF